MNNWIYLNIRLLPNTAGAKTAEEAVRIAKLAKASGLCDMIKVEVIGDDRTLLPDPIETLKASEMLLAEGFIVLPYTSDDVVLAKRLEESWGSCHHARGLTNWFWKGNCQST